MHSGVLGPVGQLKHHVPIELPGPRLPHDMAVTEHFSIVHDLSLFHDEEAMKLGRHKAGFHPELPTRFGEIPRYGRSDQVRWFSFTPCFLHHAVNAWEAGDWITMGACRCMPALGADGHIDAHRTARNVEFPTFNAALTGRRTHCGYLIDHHDSSILQWNGLRKYDLDSGLCLSAWTDDLEHSWYSEPWFAAADNPRSEDHGYVIAFQFNAATHRQTLDVFDALALPRHVPTGFHGCWISARRVAGRAR